MPPLNPHGQQQGQLWPPYVAAPQGNHPQTDDGALFSTAEEIHDHYQLLQAKAQSNMKAAQEALVERTREAAVKAATKRDGDRHTAGMEVASCQAMSAHLISEINQVCATNTFWFNDADWNLYDSTILRFQQRLAVNSNVMNAATQLSASLNNLSTPPTTTANDNTPPVDINTYTNALQQAIVSTLQQARAENNAQSATS